MYSNSFKRDLFNISKEEIIELLEEYDAINTYNFEKFYNNKKNKKIL